MNADQTQEVLTKLCPLCNEQMDEMTNSKGEEFYVCLECRKIYKKYGKLVLTKQSASI